MFDDLSTTGNALTDTESSSEEYEHAPPASMVYDDDPGTMSMNFDAPPPPMNYDVVPALRTRSTTVSQHVQLTPHAQVGRMMTYCHLSRLYF